MAHSLEVRSPLLDHRFMEMAARLPLSAKLHGKTTKVAFKDSLRPWLPDHILDRPKMGFGVPLGDWFRGALRDLPAEILLDPRSLERGYFREEGLRAIIDRHRSGAEDTSNKIWALIQLELWHRTYVDAARPAPVAIAVWLIGARPEAGALTLRRIKEAPAPELKREQAKSWRVWSAAPVRWRSSMRSIASRSNSAV